MRSIYRYEVPVDARGWVDLELGGPIRSVGCRQLDVVEFWAEHGLLQPITSAFRVFGTGYAIPDDAIYVGTAPAPGGALIWHLYQRERPQPEYDEDGIPE